MLRTLRTGPWRLLSLWWHICVLLPACVVTFGVEALRELAAAARSKQLTTLPSFAPCVVSDSRVLAGLARFWNTVQVAFDGSSYWRALALLDVWAWVTVWRTHEADHADAINTAVVEEATPGAVSGGAAALSPQLLHDLATAAVHSRAAYGHLALTGSLDSWQGFLQTVTVRQLGRAAVRRIPADRHAHALALLTGVEAVDVLVAEWQSHLHAPAWYACLDRRCRSVVVCVRGTVQLGDFLTVLDAAPECITLCGVAGHAHAGMLAAASGMLDTVAAALAEAARREPGWPVLLTGHSLGGGIAALLTLMLEELRQRGDPRLAGVGPARSISIGTAAATCQQLGEACRASVTSVVFGADALPMFSVRGARMLIDDVRESSKIADVVSRLVRRRVREEARMAGRGGGGANERRGEWQGAAGGGGAPAPPTKHCGIVCGARCSGLCSGGDLRPLDSALELHQLGEELSAAGAAAPGAPQCGAAALTSAEGLASAAAESLERCPSVASDWSDLSSAASLAGTGEGGVMLLPPGRLLWLLPVPEPVPAPAAAEAGAGPRRGRAAAAAPRHGEGRHVVVEADQSLFRRFLLLPSTAIHHVPSVYVNAIHGLLRAQLTAPQAQGLAA